MITDKGKVLWANAIGDATNGYTGTVASATSTTLVVAGTPWSAEQFAGQDVYSGNVVGTIVSNTNKTLTVARWENPGPTRGGAPEAEPIGAASFSIASGATPAAWVAVSEDSAEPKATNETLKGEIGSSKEESTKFGLVRKLATFTYISGNKYKVEVTFTAKEEDTTPVTLAKLGIFNAQVGGVMMFESLLSAEAEIKEVGDKVTITDTVSGS
jgi:hypothetical protein